MSPYITYITKSKCARARDAREGFREARLPSEEEQADFGLSTLLIGRAAAVLFFAFGVMGLAGLSLPLARGGNPTGALLVGCAAAAAGLVTWYLPWTAWPRWATHLLVPLGFVLIALATAFTGVDPYLFGVFFCAVFTVVGIAHPQGTGLKILPLFAVAYILPMAARTGDALMTATSAVFVGLACVLVAETLAWLTAKLGRSQVALSRAHSAVNEISAGLTSLDTEQLAWTASAKLAQLLDVPNVDVHHLKEDGGLLCIASIVDGEPDPDHLDRRVELEARAACREAIHTREPVLILSPDDPRLTDSERAAMLHWDEQAVLMVPLLARDKVIGLVKIAEIRKGRTITPERVATAVSVCRPIAMSILDAEALEAQKVQASRLASLLESSRAVASADTLENALTIVTRRAGEVLGVSGCVAYEYQQELDAIIARAMWEKSPTGCAGLGEPQPLDGDAVSRAVLESGHPLIERLSDPDLGPANRAKLEKWGEKSRLAIPLESVDGPMGLLTFWDHELEREYSDGEMALATGLGELAGEAVRGAKLLRELRRLSETDSLTGLANHRHIHEFLAKEQARAERYGTHFSLAMLDLDGFKLINDTYGHPAGDVVLRQVAKLLMEQTRASDIVGRHGGDEFLLILPETAPAEAGALAEKLRSALSEMPYVTPAGEQIPIRASFGIAAYPRDGYEVDALVATADANLYASKRRGGDAVTGAEEEQRTPKDEDDTFGHLESMVTAVDNKDSYTRRHSDEVTGYALAVAEALGLSEGSQRVVRVAGLLHDVGKIGIPDRILRKPGPLTAAEYDIVKGHPTLGETIVAAMPDLEEICAAVASHHERYDGTGYPQGLANGEIPLIGRILAVADAYSAMTTDRPYRRALTRQEAVAELRACAGTQFDPEIVAAFIRWLGAPLERV